MSPLTLFVVLAACFAGKAAPQAKQSEVDPANRLFQSGTFPHAGKLYSRIVAQNPKDHSAILQLARIALLSNRLDEAAKWLEKAKDLQANDTDARVMLAEVFYRRDDFQQAAASLKGVDVSGNKLIMEQYPTLNVAKLESFKGQTPYEGRDARCGETPRRAREALAHWRASYALPKFVFIRIYRNSFGSRSHSLLPSQLYLLSRKSLSSIRGFLIHLFW